MSTARPTRTRPARNQQAVNKSLPAPEPVPEPVPELVPATAPVESPEAAKPQKLQLTVIPESRIKRLLLEATSGSVLAEALETKASLELLRDARSALESGKTLGRVETPQENGSVKVSYVPHDLTVEERAHFERVVAQSTPAESGWIEKLQALKNERTRLSEDGVSALTIVVEEALKQLIKHATVQAHANKLKTIMVEHVHGGNVEKLDLYPLFKDLPSFVAESSKFTAQNRTAEWNAKLKAALAQAERDFKKKYKVPPKSSIKQEAPAEAPKPEASKTETPKPEQPEPELVKCEKADGPTSIHFIKKLHDSMGEHDALCKATRLSKPCKRYLAQLANELVIYLAPLIDNVASAMKTKTISKTAVMCVVRSFLIAGRAVSDRCEFNHEMCDDTEFARNEAAKKKADPAYVKLDTPKVNKLVAVHTVSFPGNAFDGLDALVEEKLCQKHAKKEQSA